MREVDRWLWTKVDRSGGSSACWPFTGYRNGGYGILYMRDGGTVGAHRIAFKAEYGYLPKVVMHTCDNPPCCNPTHLKGGTQRDNVEDAMAKGRHIRGEKVATAKLCERDVRDVRYLHGHGIAQSALAAQFNVAQSSISRIVRGVTWGYLL